MFLSQIEEKDLAGLTTEQKTRIVYGGCEEYTGTSDLALLLGGQPVECEPRASRAARLYLDGGVRFIMPTGGVLWDSPLGHMSEADQMKIYLERAGVPEDVIILENEATTTKENMLYGAIQMLRMPKGKEIRDITVVTSAFHMRRSMAIAENYLPRNYRLHAVPAHPSFDSPEEWFLDEYRSLRVNNELKFMRRDILAGIGRDIEF